jgi:Kdo2-lipid IVA lauroyltransferase/acyltransferase
MAFLKLNWVRKLRYRLLSIAAQGGIGIAALLPRSIGLALFGLVGSLVYLFPHVDRRRTIQHLTEIFGNTWSEKKISDTARSVYRELGKNAFDAFYLPRLSVHAFNRIVIHDSLEAVQAVYDKGNGSIVITAHTGCFEMLLHFFSLHGFKSFAIGKKLRDERLDRIIRRERSGKNIEYMDRSEPTRQIVRYLKEGRLFGVLIDQDTAVEGVFAEFLGKSAYTPSGPVKLAMKMHIPVFVATTARQKGNTHHVFIEGPIALKRGEDLAEDLVYNLNVVNAIIGKTIERFPEQWVWMHRRWRRRPPQTDKERPSATQ